MAKTFVVGYPGAGTRVVQSVAERAGLMIGNPQHLNDEKDLIVTTKFVHEAARDSYPFDNDEVAGRFRDFIDENYPEESWCLKLSEFIFCSRIVEKAVPDVKILIVVRNGLDNILNAYPIEETWFSAFLPYDICYCTEILAVPRYYAAFIRTQLRAILWSRWHWLAVEHIDELSKKHDQLKGSIIRLEDLVYDTRNTIARILNFIEIEDDPEKYLDLIHEPASIGRRNSTIPVGPEGAVYEPSVTGPPLLRLMRAPMNYLDYPIVEFGREYTDGRRITLRGVLNLQQTTDGLNRVPLHLSMTPTREEILRRMINTDG